jgi:endonuclease G
VVGIESAVRGLARRSGELYVVSGPIFRGATLQRLRGRVLVPTQIFKAVYDLKRNQAAAYLVENADGDQWRSVSISELQQITGIDPFPGLAPSVKDHAMALPDPKLPGTRQKQTESPWSVDTILNRVQFENHGSVCPTVTLIKGRNYDFQTGRGLDRLMQFMR